MKSLETVESRSTFQKVFALTSSLLTIYDIIKVTDASSSQVFLPLRPLYGHRVYGCYQTHKVFCKKGKKYLHEFLSLIAGGCKQKTKCAVASLPISEDPPRKFRMKHEDLNHALNLSITTTTVLFCHLFIKKKKTIVVYLDFQGELSGCIWAKRSVGPQSSALVQRKGILLVPGHDAEVKGGPVSCRVSVAD